MEDFPTVNQQLVIIENRFTTKSAQSIERPKTKPSPNYETTDGFLIKIILKNYLQIRKKGALLLIRFHYFRQMIHIHIPESDSAINIKLTIP